MIRKKLSLGGDLSKATRRLFMPHSVRLWKGICGLHRGTILKNHGAQRFPRYHAMEISSLRSVLSHSQRRSGKRIRICVSIQVWNTFGYKVSHLYMKKRCTYLRKRRAQPFTRIIESTGSLSSVSKQPSARQHGRRNSAHVLPGYLK